MRKNNYINILFNNTHVQDIIIIAHVLWHSGFYIYLISSSRLLFYHIGLPIPYRSIQKTKF